MTNKEILERIEEIDTYWADLMPMMVMEELAELSKAISKYERYRKRTPFEEQWDRFAYIDDIEKEIADVLISILVLKSRYEIDEWNIKLKYAIISI